MADYEAQQGRSYQQSGSFGRASSSQRDAAFSNIFGGPPPPGRSQTMSSEASMRMQDRSYTMGQYPPGQNTPPRQPPPRQSSAQYPSQQSNGYHPGQRSSSGQMLSQPQPQAPPQSAPLDRRAYPQPQRVEQRQSAQGPYGRASPGPSRPYAAGPALNNDPYRSRSMAAMPGGQQSYQAQPSGYNASLAAAYRQQYHPALMSRTTAQGRMIPERQNERAMSMTAYPTERDHTQTMSGRVIPNRRRESGPGEGQPGIDACSQWETRRSPAAQARTASMASVNSPSMSMTSTVAPPSEYSDGITPRNSVKNSYGLHKSASVSTQNTIATAQRRNPLVYPAFLSKVAERFQEKINAGDRIKNELTYKNAFSGNEAVDLIAYIVKTADRNLALLLGRALDAQKFFHDVTYDHRLRDSSSEVYQFREPMMEEPVEVNGVFTLLTDCYSPTCTRDRLCYSIACPRRLEQQAHLNLKPQPGLKRQDSRSSLHADENDEQKLWINTVSKEIADSVDDKEKKRQEVICEIMYTERDFVKDLEYLREVWIKPLRSTNPTCPSPIPEHRREKFIRTVFSNCHEVLAVNSKFAADLTQRQQRNPVVRNVGDIFLDYIPLFGPFIKYGANQLYGKYEFEKERASNPAFSKFVDETERLKESRKLELNGYLTKPTTRLARYPLLLENVLKSTSEDNPDSWEIPKAISLIRDFLSAVNVESGKAENHFNLQQLNHQLKFRPGEFIDLKLTEESRQLLFKGPLKKGPTDQGDILVYLFDHAVLLVRLKSFNKREEQKVFKKPIPLELLVIAQMDEVIPRMGIAKRPSSSLIPGTTPKPDPAVKTGFPITFKHIGKGGFETTLYATTQMQRHKWIEHIEAQQTALKNRSNIYNKIVLCEKFFPATNRVNCLVPVDGGRKLVYGTDSGLYVSERKQNQPSSKPKRVADLTNVTQIDVMEEYSLLLVLTNKSLVSIGMEILDTNETPKPKMIQKHQHFFKSGVCLGRHLVCSVKTSALSTTIKVFEPSDTMNRGQKRAGLTAMLRMGPEVLKPFKEFYIPTESSSIHFLKSKLCVGCARGFEVVSLETLETQSLLDQADTSLDFVARKESIKPIHIERLNGEFLLNYSDFSFFVNRNGWRTRPDWKINWEGQPQSFALSYPFILAFEPSFIEIRNVETSALVHIVTAKNVRMLHASTREILYAYEEESTGEDTIASLDFWKAQQH
ncbi:MAG: RHO1 GDP-GTP exchange protein 2 [Vezdaea aestivalis]|nr:MAG: RHO1 GDP-GTP exchange protein 2 [Vezdaea aestivalis]